MREQQSVPTFLLLVALAAPALGGGAVEVAKIAHPGGESLRLTLAVEMGESWREVHVGRVAIRAAGRQQRVAREAFGASRHLDLGLPEAGCALVVVDLGPASEKGRADSWRRITRAGKIVACPAARDPREALAVRRRAGEWLMGKVGGRIELRPFVNPALVTAGSDLPVRAYLDNAPRAGVELLALGPQARRLRAVTDGVGVANFRIPASGGWVIRYPTGGGLVAELEFEALPESFWDSLPASPAALPAPAQAADRWQSLGPEPIDYQRGFFEIPLNDTGRAAAVAPSATRRNRYYLGGATGGVWETVDGGASWTPLSDDLPALAIGALAVDPSDDGIIYAGSGESNTAYHSLYGFGVYKSTDRGRSWRILARQTFAGRAFSRLVVDPDDPRVVWAAVGRAGGTWGNVEGARQHPGRDGALGIFRSRDGGQSWEHLAADHGLPAIPGKDVDYDPQDSRRIYVSLADPYGDPDNGIYRTTDGGESFEEITFDLGGDQIGRIALAIAPSDPRRLYALVTHPSRRLTSGGFMPGGASARGVYRSDDGGDGWTFFETGNFQGEQGVYNTAVVVHPSDPDVFFLGGVQMLRSTDGGATYEDVTPLHVDVHDLAFDAAGRLLAASDGGLNRSSDLGETWIARNGGLGIVQFYPGLSLHPTDPWVVVGGTQDNGTNLRLGAGHPSAEPGEWIRVFGGDGGYTAIKPDDPDVLLVEYQGAGNLFRSLNGGVTFQQVNGLGCCGERTCFLPPVVFDPSNPDRLLYATYRIYESTDGGRNWHLISGDLTAGPPAAVRALAIAPADSNVVYAATNDGRVLVSNNAGRDWELSLEGVAGWPRVMRQIAVDPLRPSLAYVAVSRFGGERLLMTRDRGRSWRAIGEGLPNFPVNTVAVYRTARRRYLLVGTDAGVYVSTNNGGQWRRYGSKLPRAPVMDLVVDAERQRLVASTLGRGMWSLALPAE